MQLFSSSDLDDDNDTDNDDGEDDDDADFLGTNNVQTGDRGQSAASLDLLRID